MQDKDTIWAIVIVSQLHFWKVAKVIVCLNPSLKGIQKSLFCRSVNVSNILLLLLFFYFTS